MKNAQLGMSISLEGMEFKSPLGYFDEERLVGSDVVIDVFLAPKSSPANLADQLELTINYETVYLLCAFEVKKENKLIEQLAYNILKRLAEQFGGELLNYMKVRVKKLRPSVGGRVQHAAVELEWAPK